MASAASKPELLVIVGPTASGKSELALRAAKRHNGEIVSADSRSLYKGMDIGTAKSSDQAQRAIKHWGLDLLNPVQKFSAKQFKDYALGAIKDIKSRNKLPIVAGGTGLYVNSVIFDYEFEPRAERNPLNPRHGLKKANDEQKPIENVLIIGLDPGKERLLKSISDRAEQMIEAGFVEEADRLRHQYGTDLEAFKTTGYQAAFKFLDGEIDLEELKNAMTLSDSKLAKKQRTWFKRNKFILWYDNMKTAEQTIDQILNT